VLAGVGTWHSLVSAYVSSGKKWGSSRVSYYVNPDNLYVTQADAIAAIQNGASVWSNQSNANFEFSYAGTTNATSSTLNYKNEVFFRNDAPGPIAQTYWWADSSGRMLDSDIVFYESYAFLTHTAASCGGGYYIENTAAHEFGHALGLYHSATDTATMWATEGGCETSKETLDADDIAGVQALYPPTSIVTPPAAPSGLGVLTNATSPTSSLTLQWVDNAANESGYRIERSSDGLSFAQVAQVGFNSGSYVDIGLAAGYTYTYRVFAYNSGGTSAYSNLAAGQTQTVTSLPEVPANSTPGDGTTGVTTSVTLGWTSAGAQNYDVAVYLAGTLVYAGANLTSPSLPVSSLASGTTYTWKVTAKNAMGSTDGPTWSFTTKASPGKRNNRK
jgi:hypothetical protein